MTGVTNGKIDTSTPATIADGLTRNGVDPELVTITPEELVEVNLGEDAETMVLGWNPTGPDNDQAGGSAGPNAVVWTIHTAGGELSSTGAGDVFDAIRAAKEFATTSLKAQIADSRHAQQEASAAGRAAARRLADGGTAKVTIARLLGVSRPTVDAWLAGDG